MSLSQILAVMALAAAPVSELRGAIPLAILGFHFQWYYALPIAVIGNLLPVPFILLFLNAVSRLIGRIPAVKKALEWLFERAKHRGEAIQKYGALGLVLFVAVPLPMTGAWTASLIAVLLGLRFKYAFLSILAGIIIAGFIVTGATMLGWAIFSP